jgi:hypothetical protein
MAADRDSCPATRADVVSMYFMEHRAKVIDIAAFLDRIGRTTDDGGSEDFRVAALRRAIAILDDGEPHRARRVLEMFSDMTDETVENAHGLKGAFGTVPPESGS